MVKTIVNLLLSGNEKIIRLTWAYVDGQPPLRIIGHLGITSEDLISEADKWEEENRYGLDEMPEEDLDKEEEDDGLKRAREERREFEKAERKKKREKKKAFAEGLRQALQKGKGSE